MQYGELYHTELKRIISEVIAFLNWHRELLKEHTYLDEMYAVGLRNIDRMFSTIGIIGFADLQEIAKMTDDELEEEIKFIRDEVASYKCFTNIELVPAESAAVKLFDQDKEQFYCKLDDVYVNDYFKTSRMYSNQIVSSWEDKPFADRMEKTGRFAKYFSGGSMTFVTLQEQFQSPEQMMKLVEGIASFEVPYFCFDCTLNRCIKNGHFSVGEQASCPQCDGKLEKYRRTVGFFVPLEHMHERQTRDVPYRVTVR
jgi:anaerobic ribonucleoside-triphosphate reductase